MSKRHARWRWKKSVANSKLTMLLPTILRHFICYLSIQPQPATLLRNTFRVAFLISSYTEDRHAGANTSDRRDQSGGRQIRSASRDAYCSEEINRGHDNGRRHVSPKCHTDSHIPATIGTGSASFLRLQRSYRRRNARARSLTAGIMLANSPEAVSRARALRNRKVAAMSGKTQRAYSTKRSH